MINETKPQYAWLFIADRDNWVYCVEHASFGLEQKPGRFTDAKPGDPCVAYVRGESTFAGLGKITKGYYYDDSKIWEEGTFPHRVGIEVKLDFDNGVDVRSLVNSLGFITDKSHWPVFFRRGVARIPYADYEIIKSALERRQLGLDMAKPGKIEREPGRDVRDNILKLPELSSKSLHDRLAEMVHRIGLQMGYNSIQRYKTHPDSPYELDVAWLQIRNPQIAVEVQDKGNITEALERLRHARDFNFRKVILIVVDPKDTRRILDILHFDEKLKHWIDLWSVESIYQIYIDCSSFYNLYQKFDESVYKEEPATELI